MKRPGTRSAIATNPGVISSIIMDKCIKSSTLPITEHFEVTNKLEGVLRTVLIGVVEAAQHEFIEAAKHVEGYPELLNDAHKMHKKTVEAVTMLDIASKMGYRRRS